MFVEGIEYILLRNYVLVQRERPCFSSQVEINGYLIILCVITLFRSRMDWFVKTVIRCSKSENIKF